VLVPPFSIELATGERTRLGMPTARAASIAARMVAGIVKPTSGSLFVADFDPRIQPVQVKRMVGFVPRDGVFGDDPREPLLAPSTREMVDLHAALYEVDPNEARRAAESVLGSFESVDDVALAFSLALIRPIALLVLDQPPASLLARLSEFVGERTAVLTTEGAPATTAAERALVGAAG
jgi:hypothetical protein